MTLDPLLTYLNTEMGSTGIQKGEQLWFYTPSVVYKVHIYNYKYTVIRVSKYNSSEIIPLLNSGAISGVLRVLDQNIPFLTPTEVATQWAVTSTC